MVSISEFRALPGPPMLGFADGAAPVGASLGGAPPPIASPMRCLLSMSLLVDSMSTRPVEPAVALLRLCWVFAVGIAAPRLLSHGTRPHLCRLPEPRTAIRPGSIGAGQPCVDRRCRSTIARARVLSPPALQRQCFAAGARSRPANRARTRSSRLGLGRAECRLSHCASRAIDCTARVHRSEVNTNPKVG